MKTVMSNRGGNGTSVHNGCRRPLRVAAYCRVGNGGEQTGTNELQITHYTAVIDRNPDWEPAGIFFDKGVSGRSVDRPEFSRMMQMCRDGGIDLIICKSVSRFARNSVDCIGCIRGLRELGIGVIFEKEGINTLEIDERLMGTVGLLKHGEQYPPHTGKEVQANADSNH